MKLEATLLDRSENKCELCGSTEEIQVYEVQPQDNSNEENCIIACKVC